MNRKFIFSFIFLFVFASLGQNFQPIQIYEGSTAELTGLNFLPNFTKNEQVTFPQEELYEHLYTVRLVSTSESVTDGVALRINYDAGSKFTVTFPECNLTTFPSGYAGVTFYAKAFEPITLRLKTEKGTSEDLLITSEWQKFDFPTTPLFQDLSDWHAVELFAVETQTNAGYVLFDRFGMEQMFDPSPTIDTQANIDTAIASSAILVGAQYLTDLRTRLRNQEKISIFGWGNSIANGAQMNRGGLVHPFSGWEYAGALEDRFYGRLATKLERYYGYTGVTPVTKAKGGTAIHSGESIAFKDEIINQGTTGDLVIIEFGANDLNWNISVSSFAERVSNAVDEFRTAGFSVIIMTPPICVYESPGANAAIEPELTTAMEKIASNQGIALVNVLKLMTYRGDDFAWAWENNGCHPGYWGHEIMAQLFTALIIEKSFSWSPSQDYPERVWVSTDIENEKPNRFSLNLQIQPDPGYKMIHLSWQYPESVYAVHIYGTNGRLVREIVVSNCSKATWDRCTNHGTRVGSGLYWIHLKTKTNTSQWVKKLILP